jgi:benzylsuccinate CoA-transferase BbsF subunit
MDRRSNAYPFGGNLLCRDGYVTIFVIEEKQWRGLCHLVGEDEWIEDPRFRDGVARVANQEIIDQRLKKWCEEHSVNEVMVAARRFDVPCGAVRTIGDVVQRESCKERRFVSMRESAFGPVREMRLPFGPSFPQRSPGDAPARDSHSSELRDSPSRMSGKTFQKAKVGPLEGLKVLDFTWAAAGPIVTSYMAWLGADVVKVEFRERPDLMRTANKQYGYPGDQDLNSSPSFNEIAAGKRSIELDLRQEVDRQLALQLADIADVLVENMRPGKIEALGLGYADVARRNPRIVMCSVSATGRSSEAISGYAPIFWAEGGGAWLTGWPSANPGVVRGPVDLHVAAMATLGTLALLWRRDEVGVGGYVDCSGIEAVANCIGAELLECDVTNSPVQRSGNDQAGTIVNGLFPTSDAGYAAITVYREDELDNLLEVLQIQSLMDRDEGLYEAIADATQARTAVEIERAFVEAGMACARMRSLNEALLDPALHEAGVFQRIEHGRIGEQTIVGLPWRFDGEPYRMARPAPDLGADTSAILRDWLGQGDVSV